MDLALEKLNQAGAELVSRQWFARMVDELKTANRESQEPFVWSTIELKFLIAQLPRNIKSGWVFVLKKDVPSGCHHHPNSIQHMVMIEGRGESNVGDLRKQMIPFQSQDKSLAEIWYVIPEGVPHEFFPEEQDMVVISFHTCGAAELEEVSCNTGATRLYEP